MNVSQTITIFESCEKEEIINNMGFWLKSIVVAIDLIRFQSKSDYT